MKEKDPEYVQVVLASLETGKQQTCWLSRPNTFKMGTVISLKGETEQHEVLRKFRTKIRKSQLNTDWKVGGLA